MVSTTMNNDLLDIEDFNDRIVGAYNNGTAEKGLPADVGVARSLCAPGSGILRDFSYIAPEIPEFITENCVGCMDCVTECPDTAILGKISTKEELEAELAKETAEEAAIEIGIDKGDHKIAPPHTLMKTEKENLYPGI